MNGKAHPKRKIKMSVFIKQSRYVFPVNISLHFYYM